MQVVYGVEVVQFVEEVQEVQAVQEVQEVQEEHLPVAVPSLKREFLASRRFSRSFRSSRSATASAALPADLFKKAMNIYFFLYLFTGGAADDGDGAEGDAEGEEAVGDGGEHRLHLRVRHLAPGEEEEMVVQKVQVVEVQEEQEVQELRRCTN